MSKHSQSEENTVTVHVTSRGGLYVNAGELLRSKTARKTMKKMDRILRDEQLGRQEEEHLTDDQKGSLREQ